MRHIFKKKDILLTFCIFNALFNIAEATEKEQEKLDVYHLDDVVVTATRTPLEEKKVPLSTQVITAEDIKTLGAYNVREVLRNVTGIDVQETGMTGNQVSIRGMGTNHTLVLVDGKRMAGEDSAGTMNVHELNRINVQDVERIELIRGAGSSLYGSDAMGGVINIITKKNKPQGGYYGTGIGSREQSVYGGYSLGNIGKLNMDVNFNLTKVRKATTDATTTRMYGPKRYLEINGKYDFTENKGIEFNLSFLREQFAQDSLSTKDWYDNNRQGYSINYYGSDKKNNYNVRAYYNRLGKESKQLSTVTDKWTDFDHSKYDNWTLEGKNTVKVNGKHVLTYGAEYNWLGAGGTRLGAGADNVQNEEYLGMSKSYSSQKLGTYAAYLQDEIQLTDKFFLVPSVRYDHHSSFGGEASPKLGITYNLSKNFRIKINYGHGYRAPTIFELYANMNRAMGGMQVEYLGNADLQPETANNFDFGFEAETGKGSGKLNYFHSNVSDLINAKTFYSGYVPGIGRVLKFKYENIDAAKIDGIEGEATYQFDNNWSIKTNYTYLRAIDKATDNRLDARAKHTGAVQLSWTDNEVNPLTATLYSQWYIDYLFNANSYTYNTLNLVVDKEVNKKMRIYAGIDNIFDKTFTIDDNQTYDIVGRTWRLGAEWKL